MTDHEATTRGLQQELDTALGRLLEPSTEIAYLNFPNIGNLGDSAIYAGARQALARTGAEVVLACEPRAYRRALVAKAVGERGTVVIHGGANFGDIYRKQGQQTVRRRLLRDFPRARLIQLPQTIFFESDERARRFAALCAAHDDLTIMVRDRASVERAAALGLETVLCPDLAFGLGTVARPQRASRPLSWVVREDVERRHEPGALDPSARDWPTGAEQRAGKTGRRLRHELALLRGLNRARDRAPARLRLPLARAAASRYGPIARRRVAIALRILCDGEVLISDRFHGHLLACLMGIPNVLLDNTYGKNRGLYETWTHRYEIARFADDPAEARELAQAMAGVV